MSTYKKPDDLNLKQHIGVITNVYPQSKLVDIRYLSKNGNYINLQVPLQNSGLSWGMLSMPMKGDKVLLDDVSGDRPSIVRTIPLNTDYLPYLDPGEVSLSSENGSYILVKNKRKKIVSTNQTIDPDATVGPNGETDIQTTPGGVIIRAQSKQNQEGFIPRYDEHGYIALWDNGSIDIQSMYQGITKGLIHLDGPSGYSAIFGGSQTIQEYYELDPLTKRIVEYSDGNKHQVTQKDCKIIIYNNDLKAIVGALNIKVGIPPADIPTNLDNISVDSDLTTGDVRIDTTQTSGGQGRIQLWAYGEIDIICNNGNVNITANSGNVNVIASSTATIQAPTIDINGSSSITLTSPSINMNS